MGKADSSLGSSNLKLTAPRTSNLEKFQPLLKLQPLKRLLENHCDNMPKPAITLITASLGVMFAGAGYLYGKHSSLSSHVTCTNSAFHTLNSLPAAFHKPSSLPKFLPETHKVFTDTFQKTVPKASLPSLQENPEFLTKYARETYLTFYNFPQSHVLPGDKATFTRDHIRHHPFTPGSSPVYGIMSVTDRSDTPPLLLEITFADKGVTCALTSRITPNEGKDTVTFSVQTTMWNVDDPEGKKIMLANPLAKWYHELTAMWLLDTAIHKLQSDK